MPASQRRGVLDKIKLAYEVRQGLRLRSSGTSTPST